MAYDANGDLASVTDPLTHATTFGYDSLGRRTTVTDALNHTTTTTYDARGRVTRVTQADGTTPTSATTQEAGGRASPIHWTERPSMPTTPTGGCAMSSTLTEDHQLHLGRYVPSAGADRCLGPLDGFRVRRHGRVLKTTFPAAPTTPLPTTPAGRLATRTDRKSTVTTYSYDALAD